MSFSAIVWALAQDLPCTEKMVLVVLADFHNRDTGQCNPEKESIAHKAGLSARGADEVLKRLRAKGVVEFDSSNGRTSNHYTLKLTTANPSTPQDVQGLTPQELHGTPQEMQGSNPEGDSANPAGDSANPAGDSANPAGAAPEPDRTRKNYKEAAAASPREIIFSAGLSIITGAGTSESSARTFLGKYAKQDESKLAEVIGYLAANPKVEPKSYIAAAFKPQQRRVVV